MYCMYLWDVREISNTNKIWPDLSWLTMLGGNSPSRELTYDTWLIFVTSRKVTTAHRAREPQNLNTYSTVAQRES